jgi:tripartite-type tricarboxylate transporter receptor subunit TctC
MASMPFKGVDDFTSIALAAYVTNVLVTHPSVPAKSVPELIALLKAQPGKIAYASAGNGSPNHIAAELFCRLAGVEMLHVPYKGGGPATAGIAGGQVGVLFTGLGNVWEHVKAGRLNLLAVTEERRSELLPNIPRVGEAVPGYEVAVWYGMWAPAGMRPELQNRLNAEVNRILTLPDIKQRLDAMGAEHVSMSARETHALLQREYDRWGKIIRETGIKAD